MYSPCNQIASIPFVYNRLISASAPTSRSDVANPVSDGNIGEYVADIAEFNLNVILILSRSIDLDSGKTDPPACRPRQFRHVKIIDASAVDRSLP